MGLPQHDFQDMRDEFFVRNSWTRRQCQSCSKEYYTKRDLQKCGSYQCIDGYAFLSYPAPRSYLELNECVKRLPAFFNARGYSVQSPIAIVRHNERTLFASTAGQVHDDYVYGKAFSNPQCCIVIQPVIRLQDKKYIGLMEGISTSFLHAGTECWKSDPQKHFDTLDHWLDFFSSLGLHAANLTLSIERVDNDWAGRIVTSEMIRIQYGGLEVGVANFFINIPQNGKTVATLSDIGIGIERLIWAVNKSLSYFDGIGPLSYTMFENVILDALRTATLMVGSGVVPTHKNHGSKLRTMIKKITNSAQHLNLYEIVRYYYAQWTRLIPLSISCEETYACIAREIHRNMNLRMNHELGTDEKTGQTFEELLCSLIRKKTVSVARIHEILIRKL